jgi:peptidoglycan/LPS O-acetylase OafA/YrhL
MWLFISLSTIAAMLVISKLKPGLASDLLLGMAFASALPALAALPNFGFTYDRTADGLAKISYTLYATHFPVLAFLWFVALAPSKWPVGPTGIVVMAAVSTIAIAIATAMWWLFERRTDLIRKTLEIWLSMPRRAPQEKRM